MDFKTIDDYITEVGGRRLAEGEWGLQADGFSIGLRVEEGLLRAQCWAAAAGDPELLLRRNRALRLVHYGITRSGEVWVTGELAAADDAPIDRLLGALVEAAHAVGRLSSPPGIEDGPTGG